MALSLIERLRARAQKLQDFSLLFPEALGLHYQPDPEAILLTVDGRPLPQSDWELLKTLVDKLYSVAPEDEILAMYQEARQRQQEEDKAWFRARREEAKRPKPPKPGFVYVLTTEHGRFKIGRTANLSARLANLSTASPYNLKLVCSFKCTDPKTLEERLHEKFAPSRKRGEWFDLTREQIEWLRSFDGSEPTFECVE